MKHFLAGLVFVSGLSATLAADKSRFAAELYSLTNVLEVHFSLSPDQWKALEPRRDEAAEGRPFGTPGSDSQRSWLQGGDGKRNGLSSARGIEFDYVRGDLTLEGRRFTNVAVRYKGNGTYMMSQDQAKRPLKVDLNEFVKGQKIGGISKLNFQNNVTDPGMMNDALAYRLYRDAGASAPRTAYAFLSVSVPGVQTNRPLGVYTMVENVDANFAHDRFGTKDGLILKPVTPQPFTDLGTNWSAYEGPYDPKSKPTEAQKNRVIEFCQLVSKASDDEFARRLPEFVDLDNFSRYLAVTVWLSALDSILNVGQNYYVHLDPRTQKFAFVPWDLDHSWGAFGLIGTQVEREQLSIEKPWTGSNRFLERTFKVPAFREAYRARLAEINSRLAKPERIAAEVDEVAAAIRPAVAQESAEALKRFDQAVRGETPEPTGWGGGGRGRPPGMASKPVRAFVVARSASVADQLAGKSKGKELKNMMGRFGPGMFLAGPTLAAADSNSDARISAAEFQTLAGKWFASWDTNKSGGLDTTKLSAGLASTFPLPQFGRPPGDPGRPGSGPMVAPVGGLPPGGPNAPSGGPPRGGMAGWDPNAPLAALWVKSADKDDDQQISQVEWEAAFAVWFAKWDAQKSGALNEDQLIDGINADWNAFRGGPPGGFRPPPN